MLQGHSGELNVIESANVHRDVSKKFISLLQGRAPREPQKIQGLVCCLTVGAHTICLSKKSSLVGSSHFGFICSCMLNFQEKLVLAASHEGACRVWTLSDQRSRVRLLGISSYFVNA